MSEAAALSSRRAGGRAARVAMRAAPLAENVRPIRPGLSGGQYKPLTDANVRRIHEAALDALENIGLANAPELVQGKTLVPVEFFTDVLNMKVAVSNSPI